MCQQMNTISTEAIKTIKIIKRGWQMLSIRIKQICAHLRSLHALICAHLRSTALKKWQYSVPAI